MEKGKEKEKKVVSNNREIINLKEFMLLDSKKQDELIKDTLDKMYESDVKVTQKMMDKILNVAFDSKNIESYVQDSLVVEKDNSRLIFYFRKRNNLGLILLFLLAFLFIGGFATYTGVIFLNKASLNIDLDGDGIADLNIDLYDKGICDINCDTNKDNKPDRNIDFRGNRKPIFNVILEDGTIFNPTNQVDENGKCLINCDTNGDGWPDLNIDYDGDGKIDLDRDIDGDGIRDLDIDLNGDGVCDLNCDEDKDNVCDKFCSNVTIENNGGGTSNSTGNNGIDFTAASLIIMFDSTDEIVADSIFPDDQPAPANTKIPNLKFSVENTTDDYLYYTINWENVYNTFESTNFWVKVSGDNGGYNKDWSTAPFEDSAMVERVAIAPRSKQNYVLSFTLHGTGESQNYDQGKIFRGNVTVDLIKEDSNN